MVVGWECLCLQGVEGGSKAGQRALQQGLKDVQVIQLTGNIITNVQVLKLWDTEFDNIFPRPHASHRHQQSLVHH